NENIVACSVASRRAISWSLRLSLQCRGTRKPRPENMRNLCRRTCCGQRTCPHRSPCIRIAQTGAQEIRMHTVFRENMRELLLQLLLDRLNARPPQPLRIEHEAADVQAHGHATLLGVSATRKSPSLTGLSSLRNSTRVAASMMGIVSWLWRFAAANAA